MGTLSTTAIEKLKAKDKKYTKADGGGLSIEIMPNGSKRWRYRYRFEGLPQTLSLGLYSDISLKQARDKHLVARQQLANGINPSTVRKAEKVSHGGEDSFEVIAREWHMKHKHQWKESHAKNVLLKLEQNIFPWLGNRAIKSITPPQLLEQLRKVENRGAVHSAHRVLGYCGQVMRYAIATGRVERDITQDLKGAIPPAKRTHFATMTDPAKIGHLLRAIDNYEGSLIVKSALQFAPLVFVRPGELRNAEWAEIDWEKKEWRIPAEKMKMKELHIVPLAPQAIVVLKRLYPLTGHGDAARYVFPSARTLARPMSDNAILSALRGMGFSKEEMSGHGFRHMASTLLNEQGYNRDHIERQLAHGDRDQIRATYNYAQYLTERTKMMHEWANYLDELRAGGEVVNVKFGE